MKINSLNFPGVYEILPEIHLDKRGFFFESYSENSFFANLNLNFKVSQINVSKSVKGVIRGIHFASRRPGQTKFIQCVDGEILDIFVDLRLGSSSFGKWGSLNLSASKHNAILLPNGFGHGFQTLTNSATVMYCVDQPYNPVNEFAINPFSPELSITWRKIKPIMSDRDLQAKNLDYFESAKLLPIFYECEGKFD